MLSTILSNDNAEVRRGVAYLLSSINFKELSVCLSKSRRNPELHHKVVLMDYVHSSVRDTIAEIERLPNTTISIHDFLSWPPVRDALEEMFVSSDNISLYTRRRFVHDSNGEWTPTKVRELVLHIRPEVLSPILNPEDVSDDDLPPIV